MYPQPPWLLAAPAMTHLRCISLLSTPTAETLLTGEVIRWLKAPVLRKILVPLLN